MTIEFERPIVVCCMGRSGSSMVTAIIAKHGAWCGKCQPADPRRNPKGYWENIAIKREAERRFPKPRIAVEHPPMRGWKTFVYDVLHKEGYEGGPWVVKHFAAFWRSWQTFGPKFVLPRRDPEDIFQSTRRARFWGWADDETLREVIALHNRIMDEARDNWGGVEVFTDDVVNGDRSSLQRAVEFCGFDYDDRIATDFIDPTYWKRT